MEFSTVLDHAAASPLYNGYSTHRFLYVSRHSTADDIFLAFLLIVLLFESNWASKLVSLAHFPMAARASLGGSLRLSRALAATYHDTLHCRNAERLTMRLFLRGCAIG
jgi:hypothetical protein